MRYSLQSFLELRYLTYFIEEYDSFAAYGSR
jgi:hypothetical protein